MVPGMNPEPEVARSLDRLTWVVSVGTVILTCVIVGGMFVADFRGTDGIAARLQRSAGQDVKVDCPRLVLWWVGHTFECDLLDDGRATGVLVVTMRDEDGQVSWVRRW